MDDIIINDSELLNNLTEEVDAIANIIIKKEKCINLLLVIGIITPLIIWLVLYFFQPPFVKEKKKRSKKSTVSDSKLLMWTFIISAIIWVMLYIYSRFNSPELCIRY